MENIRGSFYPLVAAMSELMGSQARDKRRFRT